MNTRHQIDTALFNCAFQSLPPLFCEQTPACGLILGSGWSDALDPEEVLARLSYSEIPGLGAGSVIGHSGELLLCTISGCRIVAFCGPIGFVGLTVPHAARLCVGVEHRRLIPASLLGGAVFLAACHTFARIAVYPSVLPVGIVTSLLGGPIFLALLLRLK